MVGEGSVGSEFSSMFTMFINNKLDKIISPQNIMDQDEKYVLGTLKSIIGDDDKYRADIASTISTRLVNYLERYATDNKVEKVIFDKINIEHENYWLENRDFDYFLMDDSRFLEIIKDKIVIKREAYASLFILTLDIKLSSISSTSNLYLPISRHKLA